MTNYQPSQPAFDFTSGGSIYADEIFMRKRYHSRGVSLHTHASIGVREKYLQRIKMIARKQ